MEEIKAYKTEDGQLFENFDEAVEYEKEQDVIIQRGKIFVENKSIIQKHIFNNFEDSEFWRGKPRVEDLNFYHEGDYGWKCESDDSPIDKCIYSNDIRMGDDECVYCGQPEERK